MYNTPAKTTFKALVATTALLLGMTVSIVPWQAQAGRYELAQHNPAEGVIGYVLDRDACTTYLKNLKVFEHLPYGMACRRELDPKLGFTRPAWEKLDILTHIPLTLAIIKFANWEATWLPKDSKLWEARIKEMVEKENLTLELTRLDLKGNGKLMNLVRLGHATSCDPKLESEFSESWKNVRAHSPLFVADETITKVDPYSGAGSFGFVRDDVFLYKGRVHTDVFLPTPPGSRAHGKRLGILELYHFSDLGVTRVCAFEYFDTVRPQAEK